MDNLHVHTFSYSNQLLTTTHYHILVYLLFQEQTSYHCSCIEVGKRAVYIK